VRVECAAVVLAYRSCSLGSSEWKSVEQRVPIRRRRAASVVSALGSSVRSIAMAATAGDEPPSFTTLATYLPAGAVITCLMRANSRRRCIGAWSRLGRLG
jgi:hypothetical protein